MKLEIDEQSSVFALILGVARAVRAELGEEIEDQPGGPDPAGAGQVNRAFRAAARAILEACSPRGTDPSALLSWALARAARRRLEEGGLPGPDVGRLLDHAEGGGRDDWLAFLLLTPRDEITHLLDEDASGGG